MKKFKTHAACLIAASMMAIPASATLIGQSSTVAPSNDTGNFLGTLLASTLVNLTPISQTFSGTEYQEVYRQNDGTLVFAYQLNILGGQLSSDPILRATMNPFTGYVTSVGYSTAAFGGFSASSYIPLSADRNASGSTVGFSDFMSIGGGVPAGFSSSVMLIYTNATQFQRQAFMSTIDGGTSTNFALGPTGSPVPEPGSLALFGSGLVGLGLLARRKKKS